MRTFEGRVIHENTQTDTLGVQSKPTSFFKQRTDPQGDLIWAIHRKLSGKMVPSSADPERSLPAFPEDPAHIDDTPEIVPP